MKKLILLGCMNLVFADQTIIYTQQQAQIAESAAQKDVAAAKALMAQIKPSATIAESQLSSASEVAKIAVNQAKGQASSINTEYESGQKYYIFSDEMKQQVVQQAKSNAKSRPLDAGQTIAYYNELSKNSKASIGDNRMLIFVSSSIPKEQMVTLIKQAAPIGAVFVYRGMINGSMKQTQKAFMDLRQNYKVGAMINPKLFSVMDVRQVPTFALYVDDSQNLLEKACNVAPKFSKISGEISIRYALEQFQHSNVDGIKLLAGNYLDLIDSNSYYNKKTNR